MKTNHTPGPWKVKDGPWLSRVRVVWDNPKFPAVVAEAFDDNSGNAEANACLIASAPELLEIVKLMDRWNRGLTTLKEEAGLSKEIKSVLAKAEGGDV